MLVDLLTHSMDLKMEIAIRIRKIRQDRRMKQDEFGDYLDLNRSTISRLESGKQLIDQDLLKKFWDRLQVCPRWLITGEDVGFLTDKDHEIARLQNDLETTKELLAAKTEIIQLLKDAAGLK